MPWRWIPPITAAGGTQMAIDRWMLDQLEAGGSPCLRLYRWSRPTLSLGRHQQRLEPHWQALAEQGLLELVRRPSGGRAVLHAGELTYALACRPASINRTQAYRACCRWLQDALAQAGLPLGFGGGAASSSCGEAQQRSSCFATATAADLVHSDGSKRIGSAQLWRGPHLLQHGSLLLTPPAPLWKLVFGAAPPALAPLPWDGPALEQALRHSAEQALCEGGLVEQSLSPEEWRQIEAMAPL